MGVLLWEGTLPSGHAYKSAKHHAAIQRREALLLDVRVRLASAEEELRSWQAWWDSFQSSTVGGMTAPKRVTFGSTVAVEPDATCPIRVGSETATEDNNMVVSEDSAKKTYANGQLKTDGEGSKGVRTITMTEQQFTEALEKVADDIAEKVSESFWDKFESKMLSLATDCKTLRHELSLTREELGNCAMDRDRLQAQLKEFEARACSEFDVGSEGDSECTPSQGMFFERPYVALDDTGLVRNELDVICDLNCHVEWEKVVPDADLVATLREEQRLGYWRCRACKQDLVGLPGNYGMLMMKDSEEGEYEQKHIMSLLGQHPPSYVLCNRCHCRRVPCSFFLHGFCRRGSSCAYAHGIDAVHESAALLQGSIVQSTAAEASNVGDAPSWPCYLDVADLRSLCAVSHLHAQLSENMRTPSS